MPERDYVADCHTEDHFDNEWAALIAVNRRDGEVVSVDVNDLF